ncbi:hypothetical protein C9374_013902 [Naegleria lovaniensis]|uniref:Uncharacterized protein n=1 Tax=Naegleria lovaniensis TaxID=51637 RepID=A0AA88GYC3_NAELO|nr:uncharacterized protein C9374_013902 [Naegleria lovaniensis]KAG2389342.1 hypothetical protein C9374_013902 [Naegleria lovaniensis]
MKEEDEIKIHVSDDDVAEIVSFDDDQLQTSKFRKVSSSSLTAKELRDKVPLTLQFRSDPSVVGCSSSETKESSASALTSLTFQEKTSKNSVAKSESKARSRDPSSSSSGRMKTERFKWNPTEEIRLFNVVEGCKLANNKPSWTAVEQHFNKEGAPFVAMSALQNKYSTKVKKLNITPETEKGSLLLISSSSAIQKMIKDAMVMADNQVVDDIIQNIPVEACKMLKGENMEWFPPATNSNTSPMLNNLRCLMIGLLDGKLSSSLSKNINRDLLAKGHLLMKFPKLIYCKISHAQSFENEVKKLGYIEDSTLLEKIKMSMLEKIEIKEETIVSRSTSFFVRTGYGNVDSLEVQYLTETVDLLTVEVLSNNQVVSRFAPFQVEEVICQKEDVLKINNGSLDCFGADSEVHRSSRLLLEHRVLKKWNGYVNIFNPSRPSLMQVSEERARKIWGDRFETNIQKGSDLRILKSQSVGQSSSIKRATLCWEYCEPDEHFEQMLMDYFSFTNLSKDKILEIGGVILGLWLTDGSKDSASICLSGNELMLVRWLISQFEMCSPQSMPYFKQWYAKIIKDGEEEESRANILLFDDFNEDESKLKPNIRFCEGDFFLNGQGFVDPSCNFVNQGKARQHISNGRHYVGVSSKESDEETRNKIDTILRSNGYYTSFYTVHFPGAEFLSFLRKVGLLKNGEKCVPSKLYFSRSRLLLGFAKGEIYGDGSKDGNRFLFTQKKVDPVKILQFGCVANGMSTGKILLDTEAVYPCYHMYLYGSGLRKWVDDYFPKKSIKAEQNIYTRSHTTREGDKESKMFKLKSVMKADDHVVGRFLVTTQGVYYAIGEKDVFLLSNKGGMQVVKHSEALSEVIPSFINELNH